MGANGPVIRGLDLPTSGAVPAEAAERPPKNAMLVASKVSEPPAGTRAKRKRGREDNPRRTETKTHQEGDCGQLGSADA